MEAARTVRNFVLESVRNVTPAIQERNLENVAWDKIENILNKLVYLAKSSTQLQVLTSFL